jgi:hypothetical protein
MGRRAGVEVLMEVKTEHGSFGSIPNVGYGYKIKQGAYRRLR